MAWNKKIPYKGNKPMVYADKWDTEQPDFEWRENVEFDDTLHFRSFSRGRSAARGVFLSNHLGCHVEMFLGTLEPLVKTLKKGKLTGTFKFEKRGQNFGIKPV
jgi:hypothetical protein